MASIPALRANLQQRFDSSGHGWKNAAHPHLILSRYLSSTVGGDNQSKSVLMDKAIAALAATSDIYCPAFQRWQATAPEESVSLVFHQPPHQRLVLGLGNDSVLETGLTLHHTYGVPYLPGAAIKGLAAHYAHQILGADDPRYRMPNKKQSAGEFAEVLFGGVDAAGIIEYSDGWIDPDCLAGCLRQDVMTPHHGNYYMAKEHDDLCPPTDFDDPTPVPFLAVANATFHIRLSSVYFSQRNLEEGRRWLQLAMQIVQAALSTLGVGGKTASGYGRLELSQSPAGP